MSVRLESTIPDNVVEIGEEVAQGMVDALNAAENPTGANPLLTQSAGDAAYLKKIGGGTVVGTVVVDTDGTVGGNVATITGTSVEVNNFGVGTIKIDPVLGVTFPDNTSQGTAAVSPPAASTTVAGVVELATDAESIAGTSNTLAVTPAGVFNFLMSHRYRPIPIIGFTGAASGTGSNAAQPSFYPSVRGPNAGVAGNARLTALIGSPSRNTSPSFFNWSKAVATTVRLAPSIITDTAHTIIYSFGKNLGWPGYGDLTAKGIAVKLVGDVITLQVHDGTTLTNVTASTTISSASSNNDFLLYSNGAGSVQLYHQDNLVATTTAGPTGNSLANGFSIAVEIDSTAASTSQNNSFIGCISFWHDC